MCECYSSCQYGLIWMPHVPPSVAPLPPQQPSPTCTARAGMFAAPAANQDYVLKRNTILRWEQWEPIKMKILSVKRGKAAYEALDWKGVKFQI